MAEGDSRLGSECCVGVGSDGCIGAGSDGRSMAEGAASLGIK